MNKTSQAVLALLFLFAGLPAVAAKRKVPSLDQKFTPAQLQEDLRVLRNAMEQVHPALYLYSPKAEFDALFDKTTRGLNKPMTLREFYLAAAPVVETAKCGHSYFDLPRKLLKQLDRDAPGFPIPLFFIGPKALVDFADAELPLGSEVTAIDGIPMTTLIERYMPFIRSDGLNMTLKYRQLSDEFALHHFLLGGKKTVFEVEYLPPNTKEKKTTNLSAITSRQLTKRLIKRHSAPDNLRNYGFRMLDETTGLLTANSFDFGLKKKGRQKYRDFLKQTFEELQTNNAKHLIIDVRLNEGGYVGYESQLFSYLAKKPFREAKSSIAKTLDIPLEKYLDKKEFFRGVERAVEKSLNKEFKKVGNLYQVIDEKNKLYKPKANGFSGKVYFLISGWTFSGGTVLCALALQNDNVTYIGEETGGGHEFYTAGNMVLYSLPNTQCQLEVPMIRYQNDLPEGMFPKGSGVRPKHQVIQTQDDFIKGRDSVMEFTRNLIKMK